MIYYIKTFFIYSYYILIYMSFYLWATLPEINILYLIYILLLHSLNIHSIIIIHTVSI